MTIEYVMLLALGVGFFLGPMIKAPKVGLDKGSQALGARIETQLATGSGFKPYARGGDNGRPNWQKRD